MAMISQFLKFACRRDLMSFMPAVLMVLALAMLSGCTAAGPSQNWNASYPASSGTVGVMGPSAPIGP